MQFKVRRIFSDDIKNEIEKIGFSPSYLDYGVNKHKFLNIKIYNLKPEAATIIKETALSSNCDAAVHRGVLDHSIKSSNLVLSGTAAQLEIVCEKLKNQQFSMQKIADEILKQLEISNFVYCSRPEIMGILNITEDSFSDGGRFLNPKSAIEHAYKMIEDGADIIDIGAESTRPGAEAIPPDIETERLTPVVKELKQNSACKNIKISIDTRNADTARAMTNLGADIINDVSGLTYDKNMIAVLKETGANIVIMHSRGTPKDMDTLCNYKDTTEEVYFELQDRVQTALNSGIQQDKIIIDPGFGFAKNNKQNFEILKKIEEFKSLGFPILAGLSRKRFVKSILENIADSRLKRPDNDTLDDLTAQLSFYFAIKGVNIIRVHNVLKTRQALDLAGQLNLGIS